MKGDTFPRLLGDISGTNARFAWLAEAGAAVSDAVTYPCADYPTLEAAMRRYLGEHQRAAPRQAAIGIANPIRIFNEMQEVKEPARSCSSLRCAVVTAPARIDAAELYLSA